MNRVSEFYDPVLSMVLHHAWQSRDWDASPKGYKPLQSFVDTSSSSTLSNGYRQTTILDFGRLILSSHLKTLFIDIDSNCRDSDSN